MRYLSYVCVNLFLFTIFTCTILFVSLKFCSFDVWLINKLSAPIWYYFFCVIFVCFIVIENVISQTRRKQFDLGCSLLLKCYVKNSWKVVKSSFQPLHRFKSQKLFTSSIHPFFLGISICLNLNVCLFFLWNVFFAG